MIAIVVLALVFLLPVFLPPANEKPDLEQNLATAAAGAGLGGRVQLSDVATFDWDRAYVFGPYTPVDVVAHEIGGWEPMSRFDAWLWGGSFMPNEGFALVVFVRGDHDVTGYRVISPYDQPSVLIDADFAVMPRDSAAFTVTGGDIALGWDLRATTE